MTRVTRRRRKVPRHRAVCRAPTRQLLVVGEDDLVCLTGCETWTIKENFASRNGTEHPYISLSDCLNKCLEMSGCVAVDVSVVVCFIHTNINDLAASFNTSGFMQYTLLNRTYFGK